MDGGAPRTNSLFPRLNSVAEVSLYCAVIAAVFCCAARSVTAQTATQAVANSPSTPIDELLDKRGSIQFRKTPISEVVFLLSDLWKINIVAGETASGEVSGVFHDAPLRDVLSSVLTAAGYGYRREGDSLVVLPLEQLDSPESITGDSPAMIVENSIAYFTLQYTDAETLAVPLKDALSNTTVIAAYPEENRLMIKGTPDELRIATEAITQLDIPRQQVRITALIYDVSLEEIERLGVNWSRALRPIDSPDTRTFTALATLQAMTPDGATSLAAGSLSNNFDTSVLIEALDNTKEAKLLANPSITVSDRREASIQIVKRLPIIGANPVAGSNAVFSQVEFVDAGVTLRVTPRISRDGTIEMHVSPEFSVQAGSVENNPIIDSRTADTTVRVNNGHTFALGGLRQKSINETVRGVPWLKDIKYVGGLFRSHNTEVRESELIVFLKPELVETYEPNRPREQRAADIANCELDAIPYASSCPQTPECRDPFCPNHRRRSRINGGTQELEMLGGEGMSEYWMPEVGGGYDIEVIEPDAVDVLPEPNHSTARPNNATRANNAAGRISTTDSAYPPVHFPPTVRR